MTCHPQYLTIMLPEGEEVSADIIYVQSRQMHGLHNIIDIDIQCDVCLPPGTYEAVLNNSEERILGYFRVHDYETSKSAGWIYFGTFEPVQEP